MEPTPGVDPPGEGVTGRGANCLFVNELDRDGLFALLTERLTRLGRIAGSG